MQVITIQSYKSIPKGISFELPKFCVLTGKNGSGKTHLMEAMSSNLTQVTIDGSIIKKIHYVGFNQLNPQVDEQCDSNQVLNSVSNQWGQIKNIIDQYKQTTQRGKVFNDVVKDYLPRHGENPALYSTINNILKKSGKKFEDLTHDDVFKYISFVDIAQNQLFFSQCAMIFKAYHSRKTKNQFAEFQASKFGMNTTFYSEEEFVERYGPPPWDLINEILKRANLPYKVSSPDIQDFELPYRLRLVDINNGVEISVNDLSSGEKVLMSLALAIYNTQEGGSKPELLLLDEPDAPLHPHFSKLLIDTLIETIVYKTGVNVVITTHSPSTVAMSPDGSVFEIERDTKIPKMVSNSHAIDVLTSGISYLKVYYEKRKQVFVESKYDVQYLQRIYQLLCRKHNFEYQPIFLEPHSGTSNCTDVINIVNKLRLSGSDIAYGIIDYDNSNVGTESIFVLGQGSRYAIENYILDPIFVSLALIRSGKKQFSDFGISGKSAYTDAGDLSSSECQEIVNGFLIKIGIKLEDKATVRLTNDFMIEYPNEFLFHNGHDYEQKIQSYYPELNAISKGQGDSALKLGIIQVIEEFPCFLASDIGETFQRLIGLKQ